jgi:hypothetical protein
MRADGTVHLLWDASDPAEHFVLFSADNKDMLDARIENDRLIIQTNQTDWVPQPGQKSAWLAVRGVLQNGHRTRLSVPVFVNLSPTTDVSVTIR